MKRRRLLEAIEQDVAILHHELTVRRRHEANR
jgi:hypothetical protein